MYHPRLKGDHYAMGLKMGNIFKKNNVQFPINLDSFQNKFGKESGMLLGQYFPEAAAEIKGVTDVIGHDNELFTSWMMCMGCCLDIHDEDSVEVRGCTAFSFVHNGQVYSARDNDLPPFLRKISKSIYYQPENKISFILNTSSFINGEEGINQYGLVAAMTFVMPKLQEIKPGLNSVFLVRYLLENCKTVNEGTEALKKLPIASSCNILLTDKSGEMAVVECNPLKIHIRYPEKNKKDESFIITVNHFSSREMWRHDASDRNVYFSETRYQTAYNALKNTDYLDGVEHAKAILSGKHGFMCQYNKALNFETIWSSVFDISNNRVYIAGGSPQRTKYIEDKRLFNKIVN
ncbi:MAG: acyl-CoA--6-aminopenicillanic acid acyl-transferase [Deltaproteobacteria bacterium HGW-Deltaproteobacteria-12]|jgi:predicted choloylglycine hydrolase|nr:MAG: acyl-CoA--6-aminopenicillanic acid acyl-transferase [Deltaproteobacteria bacterium HGW-Deltaproteobacteria-12]